MEKDALRSNGNNNGSSSSEINRQTTSDFVLQWGNRKRPRCMKIQTKDDSTNPFHKTTVRVDRRVVRIDNTDSSNQPSSTTGTTNPNNHSNGYFNLRQRPSPPPPPPPQRILRSSGDCWCWKWMRTHSAIDSQTYTCPDHCFRR